MKRKLCVCGVRKVDHRDRAGELIPCETFQAAAVNWLRLPEGEKASREDIRQLYLDRGQLWLPDQSRNSWGR